MTELTGTLEGVGLPAIIRFLSSLKKSGCLHLAERGWQGDVYFEEGEVREAKLGSKTGLAVLDALVETLPNATFTFDSKARLTGEPSIRLNAETFRAHLDELSTRVADGRRNLPWPDAVVIHRTEEESDGAPIAFDRATLQTLLAIDGKQTVGEIVARRGTFDALWQIANLIEAGLVDLGAASPASMATVAASSETVVVEPVTPPPAAEPDATELPHCPKLGFDDDAGTSFNRPTRLHRCFAAGTPLPLSLDQQRELCLSDHFGTCPRLTPFATADTIVGAAAPVEPVVSAEPVAPRSARPSWAGPQPRPVPDSTDTDDPRIVRLPFGSPRPAAASGREAAQAAPAEPARFRGAAQPARPDANGERPRPLRARLERTVGTPQPTPAPRVTNHHASSASESARRASAVIESPVAVGRDVGPEVGQETPAPPAHLVQRARAAAQAEPTTDGRSNVRRIGIVAGAAVTLAALGAAGVLFSGQLGGLFADDSLDPKTLPNTSRVAAGTPVSALPITRATPGAAANRSAAGPVASPVARPATADPATQSDAPAQSTAAAQPTPAPATTQASASSPTSGQVLLDERFAENSANWPNNPQGTASFANGSYRVATRQAGQFVAIGAPITNLPADVVVSAVFHKLAGPAGGGYGIIVRDQATSGRDGKSQDGRYYVVEVGDKGEVGMWRRDMDHWVDLLPWQHSDAVQPDIATNELTVRAVGSTLSLSVNGTEVVTRRDSTLASGGVGLFVGGDGNQVAVDHFSIQTP